MESRTKAALFLAALGFGAIAGAQDARAADPPAPASRIGLEMISAESAHFSAEHIACGSTRARTYLRRTLRSFELRRWGLVAKNMSADTVDLVADAVYAAASSATPSDPKLDVLRRFVAEPSQDGNLRQVPIPSGSGNLRQVPIPSGSGTAVITCDKAAARKALDEADEHPYETEVDKCTRRPLAERRRDPACSLAAAVRGGLDGDVATAQANVADAVAASTFDVIYTGKTLNDAQKDALFEHIAYELREILLTEPNDDTIDTDVLRAFANIDLDAIRSWRCPDADVVKDLAEGTLDPQDAFCSATRADLQTEKVPVTITGPSNEARTLNLTGLLHAATTAARASDADAAAAAAAAAQPPKPGAQGPQAVPQGPQERDARAAEAILCSIPLAPKDKPYADCTSGALRSTQAGTFKLAVGSANWNIAVAPNGRVKVESPSHLGLAALVDGASEALRLRASIGALIHEKLLGDEPSPESFRELATVALRLRRVAKTLDDAVSSTDRHAYILAPLEAIPALLPRFGPNAPTSVPNCTAPSTPLDRMRCAASGSIRRIIIAAEDGRVGELATRVAALVGPHDQTCTGNAGGRLLEAFAAAIPDARNTSDAREASLLATEQLRAASAELAQCAPNEQEPAFRFSLIPSPALRLSWNSAYANAFGSDGFRVVPSLDFVSARLRLTRPSSTVKVAAMVSLFDPVAPLAELAMRNGELRYDRQDVLWIDAIRPRLDLAFGVPSISRHLFLTGGFALRTVAPYRGGFGKPNTTLTYLVVGTPGGAAAESFASYVEYSLGLKYTY